MALTVVVWIVLAAAYSVYLQQLSTFTLTYAGLSGLFAPSEDTLLRLGAWHPWPVHVAGEYWRLLSFGLVHFGIIHILFNGIALTQVGPLVEHQVEWQHRYGDFPHLPGAVGDAETVEAVRHGRIEHQRRGPRFGTGGDSEDLDRVAKTISRHPANQLADIAGVRLDRQNADPAAMAGRGVQGEDPPVGADVDEKIVRLEMGVDKPPRRVLVATALALAADQSRDARVFQRRPRQHQDKPRLAVRGREGRGQPGDVALPRRLRS